MVNIKYGRFMFHDKERGDIEANTVRNNQRNNKLKLSLKVIIRININNMTL